MSINNYKFFMGHTESSGHGTGRIIPEIHVSQKIHLKSANHVSQKYVCTCTTLYQGTKPWSQPPYNNCMYTVQVHIQCMHKQTPLMYHCCSVVHLIISYFKLIQDFSTPWYWRFVWSLLWVISNIYTSVWKHCRYTLNMYKT